MCLCGPLFRVRVRFHFRQCGATEQMFRLGEHLVGEEALALWLEAVCEELWPDQLLFMFTHSHALAGIFTRTTGVPAASFHCVCSNKDIIKGVVGCNRHQFGCSKGDSCLNRSTLSVCSAFGPLWLLWCAYCPGLCCR